MAIEQTDKFQSEVFSETILISGGTQNFTYQISGLNDGKVRLQVNSSGLDADILLKQYQGNTTIFSEMSPAQDIKKKDIVDTITNDDYYIVSQIDGIYLGLEIDVQTATTGTIIITGRI